MKTQRLKLLPFGANPSSSAHPTKPAHGLELEVIVSLQKSRLSIEYQCRGELSAIVFPPLKPNPARLHQLWESTCYEAFLTWENEPRYWELNFSPSGDWNLYRFESYRKGQTEEMTVPQARSENLENSEFFRRDQIILELSPFLSQKDTPLCLGLTAVIGTQNQSKSYWALTHLGQTPDFHLRDSFILEMK